VQTAERVIGFIQASFSALRNAVVLPEASATQKAISHCDATVCELIPVEGLAGGKASNVDVLTWCPHADSGVVHSCVHSHSATKKLDLVPSSHLEM
jgi:hypothetical protein